MDRDYKTGRSNNVGIFSGIEVEHTPAYGKKTLFLARNDLYFDQIIELAEKVNAEAIYFGANRTFMHNIVNTSHLIKRLLDKGYWCTIDYQYNVHTAVKENFKNIWNEERFIPFCSVIFPKVLEDKKLCIKVDDIDFNKTNPGVWTMTMDNFKEASGYTSWDQYKKDEPIEYDYGKKENKKAV